MGKSGIWMQSQQSSLCYGRHVSSYPCRFTLVCTLPQSQLVWKVWAAVHLDTTRTLLFLVCDPCSAVQGVPIGKWCIHVGQKHHSCSVLTSWSHSSGDPTIGLCVEWRCHMTCSNPQTCKLFESWTELTWGPLFMNRVTLQMPCLLNSFSCQDGLSPLSSAGVWSLL